MTRNTQCSSLPECTFLASRSYAMTTAKPLNICFAVNSKRGGAILDPDYCEEHPLGGSETAVIKMTQCLRQLGHQVQIVTRPSELAGLKPDIYVAVRFGDVRFWEMLTKQGQPAKLNYLWCQDDADQPFLQGLKDPGVAAKIYESSTAFIMISHFQTARWQDAFAVPGEKLFVSSNGIDLPRFKIDRTQLARREPHAYFASTPFRGLAGLLEAWPIVRQVIGPRAKLKICSGLAVYGDAETPENQALYDKARTLEGVEYLGSVGQAQLREVAASCRALAYPCTFPETGCIAAMEAMASGCVVVGTALGALPETAWRNPLVPICENYLDLWIGELLRVLVDDVYYTTLAEENLRLAELMGWERIARKWLMRFRSDLIQRAAP
jgi:glycosyltransferase involved in cell wall biosynthesis